MLIAIAPNFAGESKIMEGRKGRWKKDPTHGRTDVRSDRDAGTHLKMGGGERERKEERIRMTDRKTNVDIQKRKKIKRKKDKQFI